MTHKRRACFLPDQPRVREVYESLAELRAYQETFGILDKIKINDRWEKSVMTPELLWELNPELFLRKHHRANDYVGSVPLIKLLKIAPRLWLRGSKAWAKEVARAREKICLQEREEFARLEAQNSTISQSTNNA